MKMGATKASVIQEYPVEPETAGIGKNAFVHRPDYNQEGACQ